MSRFSGTYRPQAKELGLLPLTGTVDAIVGNTPIELTRPANTSIIVLRVDTGNFFCVPGTFSDFESDDFDQADFESLFDDPATTTYGTATAGQAAWKLADNSERAFAMPEVVTIKGDSATAKLYFFFV